MNVIERFLKYTEFDTQSDEDFDSLPSTGKQLILLDYLEQEMRALGLATTRSPHGYVYATLEGNSGSDKKLAFLAHVDTSPAVTGENVKAQILKYNGGDVLLNKEKDIWFKEESFPEIKKYKGQDIIFTDGTTLLGADDKAGVAEIVQAIEYLVTHPEVKHPTIKVAFTFDEEIGRGTDDFDVEKFGADFGYTIDGGELGELSYENFNAASGIVKFKGVSVHPGSAYGKMINALDLFAEFHALLPVSARPNTTKGYDGFFMVESVEGGLENVKVKYIIRDFDMKKFREKCDYFKECASIINQRYNAEVAVAEVKDSYFNMKEIIDKHPHLVENAITAFKNLGIEPLVLPIRGGTDGSHLSYLGMPTPNLSTGGHNFHGRFEYIPVNSLNRMVDVIVELAKLYA